jgi:ribose 5-phosphate isomerase B
MKIAISNDHRGLKAVEQIKALVAQLGHEIVDLSTRDDQPIDYTDGAYEASQAVAAGKADRAILVCGTGIGMCIAANKVKGIRAALCYDELAAKLSRQHNDANVLCLSGDLVGPTMLRKMVEVWLTTEFEGGRHLRRVRKIQAIEEGKDPREVVNGA